MVQEWKHDPKPHEVSVGFSFDINGLRIEAQGGEGRKEENNVRREISEKKLSITLPLGIF